ncbi:hypothetical protein ACTXT7_006575 [Hymenolepis weldensis]
MFLLVQLLLYQSEREALLTEPVEGIKVAIDESNNRYFCAIIEIPKDSPYEGGFFKLQLLLLEEYPHKPLKCLFMTKIYHPNIDQIGRRNILAFGSSVLSFLLTLAKWSPALQVRTVLLSIQASLASPNPDDFLATDVAAKWKQNGARALQTAKDIKISLRLRSIFGEDANTDTVVLLPPPTLPSYLLCSSSLSYLNPHRTIALTSTIKMRFIRFYDLVAAELVTSVLFSPNNNKNKRDLEKYTRQLFKDQAENLTIQTFQYQQPKEALHYIPKALSLKSIQ